MRPKTGCCCLLSRLHDESRHCGVSAFLVFCRNDDRNEQYEIVDFCGLFPKSFEMNLRTTSFYPLENEQKGCFFNNLLCKNYPLLKIISLIIRKIIKKYKKSAWMWLQCIGKSVFLRSQLRGKRGESPERGRGVWNDWGCSLKEWKDVANTQGFF